MINNNLSEPFFEGDIIEYILIPGTPGRVVNLDEKGCLIDWLRPGGEVGFQTLESPLDLQLVNVAPYVVKFASISGRVAETTILAKSVHEAMTKINSMNDGRRLYGNAISASRSSIFD